MTPSPAERQLAWQQWRNEEYANRRHSCELTAKESQKHAGDRNAEKTERYAAEASEAMLYYHRVISPADTAMKAAARSGDAVAWSAALDYCEKIMRGEVAA